MTFKTEGQILMIRLNALELNIDKNLFAELEHIDETLHILEGEFLYCGLVIDAQLIVNEEQLNDFISFQSSLNVYRVLNSKLYIKPNNKFNLSKYKFKHEAQFVSTENIDTDDEYEIFKLKSNSQWK